MPPLPAAPDPAARYVIYRQGAILTGAAGRPVGEHFGPCEYQAILERFSGAD